MAGLPVVIKAIYNRHGDTFQFTDKTTIDPAVGLDLEQLNRWYSCINHCQLNCFLVKRYLETVLKRPHCIRSKSLGSCTILDVSYQAVTANFALNPMVDQKRETMALYDPFVKWGNHVILKLTVEGATGRRHMFVDPSYLQVDPWSSTPVKFFVDFPLGKYSKTFTFADCNPFLFMEGKPKDVLDALSEESKYHPYVVPLLRAYTAGVYRLLLTEIVRHK